MNQRELYRADQVASNVIVSMLGENIHSSKRIGTLYFLGGKYIQHELR